MHNTSRLSQCTALYPVFVCITTLCRKLVSPGSTTWRGHAFARVAHFQRHRKSRQRCSAQLRPGSLSGKSLPDELLVVLDKLFGIALMAVLRWGRHSKRHAPAAHWGLQCNPPLISAFLSPCMHGCCCAPCQYLPASFVIHSSAKSAPPGMYTYSSLAPACVR